MKVTRDQVIKVAKLAYLPLNDEELERYSQQLTKILDYVDQLNQVETSSVEPTFNVTSLTNVSRSDEVNDSITQEEATQNVDAKDGLFSTKGVFTNE